METSNQIQGMLEDFYEDEIISYNFYAFLGNRAKNNVKAKFLEMAGMEKEHARIWREDIGINYPIAINISRRAKIRLFFLKLLALFLPLSFMINYIELGERGALQQYTDALKFFGESNEHIRDQIQYIMKDEILHEATLAALILGSSSKISNVKEAIYGMTDSLIEILALVIGLASIMNSLLLIGLSGMLAAIGGTFSMVSGAYLSVQSQNDIYVGKQSDLHAKHKLGAKYVADDLQQSLIEKGLVESIAKDIAQKVADEKAALLGLAETVIIEEELADPKAAATTTGIYYVLGSLPTFVPFFIAIPFGLSPMTAALIAVGLSAILAFVAGVFTAVLSGINIGGKGIKNVLITIGAALVTYLFGTIARSILGISI